MSRSVVKVSISELEWEQVCHSQSEHVTVGVGASMSELLE